MHNARTAIIEMSPPPPPADLDIATDFGKNEILCALEFLHILIQEIHTEINQNESSSAGRHGYRYGLW